MVVVPGIEALTPALGRLFVVVGVFDGLHLGHQYLIRALRTAADERGARPAVITFDHHPDEVLTGKAPPILCDPAERMTLLDAAGVEITVIQHFDVALRETPYDAFIGAIADRVELAGFLMTPESAFGFQRQGTPDVVAALGRTLGYHVVVVPPFVLAGDAVTSTAVRNAIAAGDLGRAQRLLGRAVSISGTITEIGGVATVDFTLPVALPPPGRYRVVVRDADAGREAEDGQRGDGREAALAIEPDAVRLLGEPAAHPRHVRLSFA